MFLCIQQFFEKLVVDTINKKHQQTLVNFPVPTVNETFDFVFSEVYLEDIVRCRKKAKNYFKEKYHKQRGFIYMSGFRYVFFLITKELVLLLIRTGQKLLGFFQSKLQSFERTKELVLL